MAKVDSARMDDGQITFLKPHHEHFELSCAKLYLDVIAELYFRKCIINLKAQKSIYQIPGPLE